VSTPPTLASRSTGKSGSRGSEETTPGATLKNTNLAGPPLEYFKASSDNAGYGNGGKRKFGKGIARMEYDAAPKLLYNAPLHTSIGQCCCGMITNPQVSGRSYIWVMENRLETNMATGCHPMCGPAEDAVEVKYWDEPSLGLLPMSCVQKCLSCRADDPRPAIEWFNDGCLCCCIPCMSTRQCIACCCPGCCSGGEALYQVPYEQFPCPCCCCSNRVSGCGCPLAAECSQAIACCSFTPIFGWCCGIPVCNPCFLVTAVLSGITQGGYLAGLMACCIIPCAALDGNMFGCCGQPTGAPKQKSLWLKGGLKDEQTGKEMAAKVNAVITEYFKDGETVMHAGGAALDAPVARS